MKYLTYEVWYGLLNNVRMSFECAAVLAHILKRKLVVSTKFSRNPEARIVELFDLERLRQAVDVVLETDPDYESHLAAIAALPPGQKLELQPCPSDPVERKRHLAGDTPSRSVFCFPTFPTEGTPEYDRFVAFLSNRYAFRLPRHHDSYARLHVAPLLEHFYSFFFLPPALEKECKELVRDYVRYRPELVDAAGRIVSKLGSFNAAHVRRGDFFDQRSEQCYSAELLEQSFRNAIPPGSRLYIATNEPDPAFFDSIRKSYEVLLFDDVADGRARSMEGEWIAATEQIVCAAAEVFVGTMSSTFSGYITRLRGYAGLPNQTFYFTDGSSDARPRSETEFSWSQFLAAGNRLWMREFHEGWSPSDRAPARPAISDELE